MVKEFKQAFLSTAIVFFGISLTLCVVGGGAGALAQNKWKETTFISSWISPYQIRAATDMLILFNKYFLSTF